MALMFYGASKFNQNLCQWRSAFPYNNAGAIFILSNCTYKATPSSTTKVPWCAKNTCP
jgi:hypothetical protein